MYNDSTGRLRTYLFGLKEKNENKDIISGELYKLTRELSKCLVEYFPCKLMFY